MGSHRKQSRWHRKRVAVIPVVAMCAGLVTSATHSTGTKSLSETMPTLEPIHHTAPIAIPTSWETFTYAEGEAIPHITHAVTVTPQSHQAHVEHEAELLVKKAQQAAQQQQTQAAQVTPAATASASATPVIPHVSGSFLAKIVEAAQSQLGIPYVYGGEAPGIDFDCSGLTQWAYSMAGASIPRVADDQFRALTMIPESQAVPGDLVFFHDSSDPFSYVYHVGIYMGPGMMLVAPQTGQDVQIQSYTWGGDTVTFGALDK